jgi:hypothetical protein
MKKIRVLFIMITFITVSFLSSLQVNAQARLCVPGTGGNGQPACQPCNPGPYNICVPETGIIETISEDLNPVHFLVGSLMLASIGYILIINGKKLKTVTKNR